MEKLMDHTLQRQVARVEEQNAQMASQIAKLTELLEKQMMPVAARPADGVSTIVNSSVTQQHVEQKIHIDKVEIHPWDSSRAVLVDVSDVAAAFAENTRLQEYARLPDHAMVDPEIGPPYVVELFTDLVRRGHADPASRNIYLNPRRADQVLVQLKSGSWEVKTSQDGYRALLDGVAMSVHEITLTYEKRKQLPTGAQNALAMAGLVYDDKPEVIVERAKATLTAHLMNIAPGAKFALLPVKS
jgi:hypothetical protein